MPTIHLETLINAPAETCFDMAISVDAHTKSAFRTKERAVAGVTSGQLKLGESVTWEAVHFGIKQRLTSKITRYERPHIFVDEMVSGAFRSFAHKHEFKPVGDATMMIDTFRYRSPLSSLGVIADKLFLERYMRNFLRDRALYLKRIAEKAK